MAVQGGVTTWEGARTAAFLGDGYGRVLSGRPGRQAGVQQQPEELLELVDRVGERDAADGQSTVPYNPYFH